MGKFASDTIVTFSTKGMDFVVGIGVSIIIARYLGPEGRGIYVLAMLLPTLLASFGNFGLGQAAVYYLGQKKYSKQEVFGNTVSFSLILGCLAVAVGLVIVAFFDKTFFPGVNKTYLYLAIISIPIQFFVGLGSYALLGSQRIREFNYVTICQTFVFLILLFVFVVQFSFRIGAAIVTNIAGWMVACLLLLAMLKREVGTLHLMYRRNYFKDSLDYGWKVYIGNLISFFHYRIVMFLMNMFANPAAVGHYSISVALAEKVWLISQSAGIVLFPKISAEKDKATAREFTALVCRVNLVVVSVAAVALAIVGRFIIRFLYSEAFLSSVTPLRILLFGSVSISGWRILANDLYGRGRPDVNIYINLGSLVLNIILNILWIPKYGIIGGAWSTSISYTFAFIVTAIVHSRMTDGSFFDFVCPRKSDLVLVIKLVTSFVRS